jgi:hypothetical protein
MPWAVGRYNSGSYPGTAIVTLLNDISWCKANNVDYVPLVFPGFSWANMHNDPSLYNQIPRDKGDFLWAQVAGAKSASAGSLYVAMFDEMDEGTAIFKCATEGFTPLNASGKFVSIEQPLASDYYLWLIGQATKWIHGDNSYGLIKPARN